MNWRGNKHGLTTLHAYPEIHDATPLKPIPPHCCQAPFCAAAPVVTAAIKPARKRETFFMMLTVFSVAP